VNATEDQRQRQRGTRRHPRVPLPPVSVPTTPWSNNRSPTDEFDTLRASQLEDPVEDMSKVAESCTTASGNRLVNGAPHLMRKSAF
jgi:hypothetical protein